MPGLVIKDLPETLHRKLKEQAARHHRSMTREALALLEQGLGEYRVSPEAPPPFKGRIALTGSMIDKAKRSGRA